MPANDEISAATRTAEDSFPSREAYEAMNKPWIVEDPQIRLRFVRRFVPLETSPGVGFSAARMILQQEWVISEVRLGLRFPIKTEWRDVPLVEEGQTASEIADALSATGMG